MKTYTITLSEREYGWLEMAVSAAVNETGNRYGEAEASRNDMYKHLLSKLVEAEREQGWVRDSEVGSDLGKAVA